MLCKKCHYVRKFLCGVIMRIRKFCNNTENVNDITNHNDDKCKHRRKTTNRSAGIKLALLSLPYLPRVIIGMSFEVYIASQFLLLQKNIFILAPLILLKI